MNASAAASRPAAGGGPSALLSALQSTLAAEHAAIYGYGVVGAHLTGTEQATATSDWIAHQVARDDLEAMLRSLGTQPRAAAAAYQLPMPVLTAPDAISLAILIEDRVATAYLGLVAVNVPAVRHLGAVWLRAAALRATSWRGTTVAFPGLPASVLRPGRRA